MKLQAFAIKDRALQAFMQPFFAPTIGAAVRAFSDGINDPQSVVSKHPDDYDLWHLGEFDDNTGKFIQTHLEDGQPQQVALGKQVRVAPSSVTQ